MSARIRVRVSPGAARSEIVARHGDGWKVRVTVAPERGRANVAVVRLLANALDLPEGSLSLVAGQNAREKVVIVDDLDPAEVDRRLESASRK